MTNRRVGFERLARCRGCGKPLALAAHVGGLSCSESCRRQKPARQEEHRDSIICRLYALGVDPSDISAHYKMSRQAIMRIINAL